jgi:hypothetical protein
MLKLVLLGIMVSLMAYLYITEYSMRKECKNFGNLVITNPREYDMRMLNICSYNEYDIDCIINIYRLKEHIIEGVNNNKTLNTICNEIKINLGISHYLFGIFLLLL